MFGMASLRAEALYRRSVGARRGMHEDTNNDLRGRRWAFAEGFPTEQHRREMAVDEPLLPHSLLVATEAGRLRDLAAPQVLAVTRGALLGGVLRTSHVLRALTVDCV